MSPTNLILLFDGGNGIISLKCMNMTLYSTANLAGLLITIPAGLTLNRLGMQLIGKYLVKKHCSALSTFEQNTIII